MYLFQNKLDSIYTSTCLIGSSNIGRELDRCLDLSNLYLRQKYCCIMLEANLKENFDCVNALLGTSYFSGEAKHISIYDLICICMNLC